VVTLDGRPVSGAAISVAGTTGVIADSLGWFSIPGVRASERLAVNVTADAFVSTTAVYPVQAGRETYRILQLIPRAPAQRVDPARGGELALGRGGTVRLEPGSLVDAEGRAPQGDVFVRATYIDPADPAQVRAAPGDFLSGAREGGGPLETLGMAEVFAVDRSGRVLRLAENRTATIAWPRANADVGGSLYWMDNTNGRWNRSSEVGVGPSVIPSLLPSWNWDRVYPYVCIRVKTAPGTHVVAQGVNHAGVSRAWSDAAGIAVLGVMASSPVDLGVDPANPLVTQRITAPAGPIVPVSQNPNLLSNDLVSDCPAPIPLVATLTIPRIWIEQRQIGFIQAFSVL
jgi:hypothetical protein